MRLRWFPFVAVLALSFPGMAQEGGPAPSPPQQAGQDVGPAGTLPPSPGVDAQRPSAPVVPPVLAGPDPRVDSLRGRLQALEARIAAIRAAMDEDRRQAALGGGPTAEQMMRRLSSLRDLRVRARDVNSDVARLREDLNAIWIRLSDDLRASATAIENWGWVTAPRQDQSALPLDLSLTQVVQSARTRAQDEQRMNEARVRQIGELLADTARPEAERQALLAERASRTARPISPDFVEQQVRSAFDVYDRQRSAYRQIEQLFVSSDRAFIDSERLANQIDSTLADLYVSNAQQNDFRSTVTSYFAMLIGFVIILFFLVCFCDQQIRGKIFGGDSGIQFVTLFALVIAIILFGVMGILEGKELAALLGGLSGYILGRGSKPA